MRFSKISFYALLCLSACVTPYDATTPFRQQLVVEGLITDQPGPYVVKLSTTVSVSDQLGESAAVSGATVVISDDGGHQETLTEKESGSYYTSSLQGRIGASYTLTITTGDGKKYQSTTEKLIAVGDFSNLRYQFQSNEPSQSNRQISSTNGFNILLDAEVLPDQGGLVWWRWSGTFHIFTYPSLQTQPGNAKVIVQVPDPPLCSGYYASQGVLKGPISSCSCCDCWVSQYNQIPLISDPNLVSQGKISQFNVAFIEANRRTMFDKYHLVVDQMSVSPIVYNFWKTLQIQQQNSSNLFQTPPPKTGGNITALSADGLPVIGYFAASSVKSHSIEMSAADVPYKILPIDTLAVGCTQVYKNSTNQKPPFW